MSDFFSKVPYRVIVAWLVLIFILYNFFSSEPSSIDITPSVVVAPSKLVDAVVFIAMGKMVEDPMVDYSIASVRKLGKWKGEIYVLTDSPQCFATAVEEFKITTISVPKVSTIIEMKALKPILMSYMPDHVNGVLYLDVDILVTKNLMSFFQDLGHVVYTKQLTAMIGNSNSNSKVNKDSTNNSNNNNKENVVHSINNNNKEGPSVDKPRTIPLKLPSATSSRRSRQLSANSTALNLKGSVEAAAAPAAIVARPLAATTALSVAAGAATAAGGHAVIPFDFGAFPDAKGHYVGWCSGCEKWHSGVMWLRRGQGESCLKAWRDILLSGKFDTDQESLDYAETSGSCPHGLSLPTRHLLFAKDYIAMALTSGQTFIHVTAAGRKEDTDWFYREVVIPRLRKSLHPPLNPNSLNHRKKCMNTPDVK